MSGVTKRGPREARSLNRTRMVEDGVMDRYEAGRSRDALAADLGVPADRVRMVLSYMAPKATDHWASAAARGSAALLAAIRQHHPEMVIDRAAVPY